MTSVCSKTQIILLWISKEDGVPLDQLLDIKEVVKGSMRYKMLEIQHKAAPLTLHKSRVINTVHNLMNGLR